MTIKQIILDVLNEYSDEVENFNFALFESNFPEVAEEIEKCIKIYFQITDFN